MILNLSNIKYYIKYYIIESNFYQQTPHSHAHAHALELTMDTRKINRQNGCVGTPHGMGPNTTFLSGDSSHQDQLTPSERKERRRKRLQKAAPPPLEFNLSNLGEVGHPVRTPELQRQGGNTPGF